MLVASSAVPSLQLRVSSADLSNNIWLLCASWQSLRCSPVSCFYTWVKVLSTVWGEHLHYCNPAVCVPWGSGSQLGLYRMSLVNISGRLLLISSSCFWSFLLASTYCVVLFCIFICWSVFQDSLSVSTGFRFAKNDLCGGSHPLLQLGKAVDSHRNVTAVCQLELDFFFSPWCLERDSGLKLHYLKRAYSICCQRSCSKPSFQGKL